METETSAKKILFKNFTLHCLVIFRQQIRISVVFQKSLDGIGSFFSFSLTRHISTYVQILTFTVCNGFHEYYEFTNVSAKS